MQSDCIILGGGASGLCAAAFLGRSGLRVTVLERLDRVGKKILATGNGRCNLSNTDMDARYYGKAAPFVSRVYANTPPAEVLAFFSSLGLMTACEDGRIYPRTRAAASVLDVLRLGCERENVTVITGCDVTRILPSRRGGWSVQTTDGQGYFAPHVLCAMGGSAAPSMGTDGSGVRLLSKLGHTQTPLLPSLVQLKSDHPALRSLKGIRTQAKLTLTVDGKTAAEENGELLFADYGVSGVCIFQLSGLAAQALHDKQTVRLFVNFLPEVTSLPEWLDARIHLLKGVSVQTLMTGVLPRLLVQAVLRQADLPADMPTDRLTNAACTALCRTLGAFPFDITGTQGFANAQVTRGGIALDEVDPTQMTSRLFDGLYLTGELLDVDGPCGGYNLHFAFAGALTACKAILR